MHQFFHYQSHPVHFSDTGQGTTIVLLHGFTESLQIWSDYAEALQQSFRVICIDLPGHGRSENIDDVHSMELMADVIKAVLTFRGVEKCIMIGHSMGGYVALAYAEVYPTMLQGLVLFHSQADADDETAMANRERTIALIRQNRSGFINQFIPDLFAESNRERLSAGIESLKNQAGSISSRGLIAALEGMKIRKNRRHVLQQVSCPVLFIAGKLDTRIPIAKVAEQVAIPAHSEAILLDGVGHMGYLEAKEIILGALIAFIRRLIRHGSIQR